MQNALMVATTKTKKNPRVPIVPSWPSDWSGHDGDFRENKGEVKCERVFRLLRFAHQESTSESGCSRGGTRGTEACLGRSASVGGKYFRIVCSSNVQIS